MELTPSVPAERQVVQAYGDGGFRVSGTAYPGSILVLPDRTMPWPISEAAAIDIHSLQPVREAEPAVELLLIGCGTRMALIPPILRTALDEIGIVVDAMDTGAACRTYNVLLAEERRVAAALIAVD